MSNRRWLGGASTGRQFLALIQHRGEGKRRGGIWRGSVGDTEAQGGGASAEHDGSRSDGWSSGVKPEEGDDPGGPVLGRMAAVTWADFKKFHGKSRQAAKATRPN
jgi:hypothetical protein